MRERFAPRCTDGQNDKAPIVIEAAERIDALFAIESEINGRAATERLRVRTERSQPLIGSIIGAGLRRSCTSGWHPLVR